MTPPCAKLVQHALTPNPLPLPATALLNENAFAVSFFQG